MAQYICTNTAVAHTRTQGQPSIPFDVTPVETASDDAGRGVWGGAGVGRASGAKTVSESFATEGKYLSLLLKTKNHQSSTASGAQKTKWHLLTEAVEIHRTWVYSAGLVRQLEPCVPPVSLSRNVRPGVDHTSVSQHAPHILHNVCRIICETRKTSPPPSASLRQPPLVVPTLSIAHLLELFGEVSIPHQSAPRLELAYSGHTKKKRG